MDSIINIFIYKHVYIEYVFINISFNMETINNAL